MNSMILPNVELGDFTIVGSGSVVTKPFVEEYGVLAGDPAKLIRRLNPEDCIPFEVKKRYHGFISADKFSAFRDEFISVKAS